MPPEWVEVEYNQITLLPFFGQVVYVNVTPERSAQTRAETRKATLTVTSACKELPAASDLTITQFYQGDLDIYGADAAPGPKATEAAIPARSAMPRGTTPM